MRSSDRDLSTRAAVETARAHGIEPDRCDVLQDGHTLVLRLTSSLVARVVTDRDGPRRGTEWFEREIAVAQYLAAGGAPVIPVHPDFPPGPYEHLGYALNFWRYVESVEAEPAPSEIGKTLHRCHELLRTYSRPLPELGVLEESLELIEVLRVKGLFSVPIAGLLRERLGSALRALRDFPFQPLHGDAHPGNFMNTTGGLLLTDWEDAFRGPVEWDLASILWNARLLDEDHETADAILAAYRDAGGACDNTALRHAMIARAAVMSAWYPILYPDPTPERKMKLQRRLDFLESCG